MVSRGCRVCGADPCGVVVPPPPAPFAVARLGAVLWFNIPSSLNWDWFSIDQDGWWCWEDLWHAGTPELVPFDWSTHYWGCPDDSLFGAGEVCRRVWTVEEMGRLVQGCPGSAPTCGGCGSPHSWPHPKEIIGGR